MTVSWTCYHEIGRQVRRGEESGCDTNNTSLVTEMVEFASCIVKNTLALALALALAFGLELGLALALALGLVLALNLALT